MSRTVRFRRHALVGFAIAVMALLAGFGVIGAGDEALIRPQHFDAKQVTVSPDPAGGVRIREVVDIDFGWVARHGYERRIPNDLGVPVDVTAVSPEADDGLGVTVLGDETLIRVGDPDITFTGRHRYVVEYRLPDAVVIGGPLGLDIIFDDEPFETERFEVVLTGFQFDPITCSTGRVGDVGGCSFEADDSGNLTAVFEPLARREGITIVGVVTSLSTPVVAAPADPPPPIPSGFRPLGFVMIALGLAAASLVYLIGRWAGSNTVAAGGAVEAAFGELPAAGTHGRRRDRTTSRVPDSRLADLATIEFSPPRDLRPWQAAMVLREAVDDDTVAAWFSEMIAGNVIVATERDDEVRLGAGPGAAQVGGTDLPHVNRLFKHGEVVLGKRNKAFTTTWNRIRVEQLSFASRSGWWSRGGPGRRSSVAVRPVAVVVGVLLAAASSVALVWVALPFDRFWRTAASPWVTLVPGFLVPLVVARAVYRPMFASRTALGSALAIRAESFRRLLASSEGKHVDWAWEHGLVREYSAWAVALGAAEAWSKAVKASNIPDPQVALGGPMLVYSAGSDFSTSHSAPRSSGGSGGSTYSSGGGSSSGSGGGEGSSVGSGGGGGSSGSW